MKPFSFFALSRVPFSLLPPSLPLSVFSPSDFPRYYPANLTTLTFLLPLLRFDLPLRTPLLPLPPFTLPLLPSDPFPLSTLLDSYSVCTPSSTFLASHLRPSLSFPSLLPPLPLYCSHPSLFRSPTTLSPPRLSCSFLHHSCFCLL